MKAKICLLQSIPPMAKVCLGHLEYEIEQPSLETMLKEYIFEKNLIEGAMEASENMRLKQSNTWLCNEIERLSKLEDPREELKNLVVYLNTPIAVA